MQQVAGAFWLPVLLCCGHAVLALPLEHRHCDVTAGLRAVPNSCPGRASLLSVHPPSRPPPLLLTHPPLAEAAYRSGNQPDLLLALYRLAGALGSFPLPRGSAQGEMVGRQEAQTMDLALRKQVGGADWAVCWFVGGGTDAVSRGQEAQTMDLDGVAGSGALRVHCGAWLQLVASSSSWPGAFLWLRTQHKLACPLPPLPADLPGVWRHQPALGCPGEHLCQ